MKTTVIKIAMTLALCLCSYFISAQKGVLPIPQSWFAKVFSYAVYCKNQTLNPPKPKPIESNVVTITVIKCAESKEEKKIIQ